jgi:hypothetical protein
MEHDREEKTPSTDLSGDFDMIVNELLFAHICFSCIHFVKIRCM